MCCQEQIGLIMNQVSSQGRPGFGCLLRSWIPKISGNSLESMGIHGNSQGHLLESGIAFKTPLCSFLEMPWPHCLIGACVIGRILKPAFGDGDFKAREQELELERELKLEVPGLEANRVIASALCTSTVVEVVVCPGGALTLAFFAFLAALAEVPDLCFLISSGLGAGQA